MLCNATWLVYHMKSFIVWKNTDFNKGIIQGIEVWEGLNITLLNKMSHRALGLILIHTYISISDINIFEDLCYHMLVL